MTENENLANEIIAKCEKIKLPTFKEKVRNTIEDVLCILQSSADDKKKIKVCFEILFDFGVLNDIQMVQQNYWQKILLDWKCKEFEEKEGNSSDINTK